MKRFLSLLIFTCAVGCGGNQPGTPPANQPATPPEAAPSTPTPSKEEAVSSIREFFPAVGFSNVEVENMSEPVFAPKEAVRTWGEVWVYSVTMNCNNIVGDRQLNKNWLVLVGRENGRATVKEYYHNLDRVQQSPLGKEWLVQKGLPEPSIVHSD